MDNKFEPDTYARLKELYYKKQFLTTDILTAPIKRNGNSFEIPKTDTPRGESVSYEIPKTEEGFESFLLRYKAQEMKKRGFDMSKTTIQQIFDYQI